MMLLTCHSYTTNNLNYNYYIFVKSFDLDDFIDDFIDDINDKFVKSLTSKIIILIMMLLTALS